MRRLFICLAVVAAVAGGCNCNNKNNSGPDGGDGGDAGPIFYPDGGAVDSGCKFNCSTGGNVPVITLGDGGVGSVGDGGPGSVTGTGTGVVATDAGVTLGTVSFQGSFAWIADTNRGFVSKFDTKHVLADGGLSEVARYYSGIPVFADGGSLYSDGGAPFVRATYTGRYGNSPSRTVIDLNGDMWVGNRAPDLEMGSVTKIASNSNTNPALSGCIDRNGDGFIQTSRDVNGNGVIDENLNCLASDMNDAGMLPGGKICEWIKPPADDPDPSHYDECVLFSSEVGLYDPGAGGRAGQFCCDWVKPRGVAVSGGVEAGSAGSIWVVHHHDQRVYKFNGDTDAPSPVGAGKDPWVQMQFGGYGAIVDSQERLYVIRQPSNLAFTIINTVDGTVMNPVVDGQAALPSATSNYGLGIDGKDRLWVAGWSTSDNRPHAYRYAHPPGLAVGMTGAFTDFTFDAARSQIGTTFGKPRGIAADNQGTVWISADSYRGGTPQSGASAQVLGFNGEDGTVKRFVFPDGGSGDFIDVTSGKGSIYDGNGLPLGQSIGVALDSDNNVWVGNFQGTVMKMNPDGGAFNFNVNQGNFGAYYSYSDFTGYELNNYTSPRGSYTLVITGCDTGNERWDTLTWDATTPPNTAITATVKSSNTTNFATSQAYTYTASPANLQGPPGPVPPGKYLQVTFALTTTDRTVRPTLNNVRYSATCLTQTLH